jgi:hypothetical protein
VRASRTVYDLARGHNHRRVTGDHSPVGRPRSATPTRGAARLNQLRATNTPSTTDLLGHHLGLATSAGLVAPR